MPVALGSFIINGENNEKDYDVIYMHSSYVLE
jgi:hypothetical protein